VLVLGVASTHYLETVIEEVTLVSGAATCTEEALREVVLEKFTEEIDVQTLNFYVENKLTEDTGMVSAGRALQTIYGEAKGVTLYRHPSSVISQVCPSRMTDPYMTLTERVSHTGSWIRSSPSFHHP